MGDADQARAEARIGQVLNEKWTLERLLGLGGMAAVYAGLHRNGARAAVKVLHPELAHDGDIRERFLREGYVANQVAHPGAVQVLDDDVVTSGPDQGTAYLVMELLEGEPLDERVRRSGKPLDEDEVLAIADDVLAVLEAAHAKDVVHRDIKPENLFLTATPEGGRRVKVLDFGLARLATGMNTHAGIALGTPSFMAPEQARGHGDEVDGRTDLFGLGATMFRLLTGARIHDGASGPEIAGKMATIPAPSIRTVAPALSPAVVRVVDRALQFDKNDRYHDATEMRADVRVAREQLEIAAKATAELERQPTLLDHSPKQREGSPPLAAVSAPAPVSIEPRLQRPEKPKRSRLSAMLGLGWVIAVAAAATVVFMVRARLIGQHDERSFGDATPVTGEVVGDAFRAADPAAPDEGLAAAASSSSETVTSSEATADAGDVEELDDDDEDDDVDAAGTDAAGMDVADLDAAGTDAVASTSAPKPKSTAKPPGKKKPKPGWTKKKKKRKKWK